MVGGNKKTNVIQISLFSKILVMAILTKQKDVPLKVALERRKGGA